MSSSGPMTFNFFDVKFAAGVAYVALNRPSKRNAMTPAFFEEIGTVFRYVASVALGQMEPTPAGVDPLGVRCVILHGVGPAFTAGLDLSAMVVMPSDDPARTAIRATHTIRRMQDAFTAVSDCPVPVVAVVHGYCLGAGVDLIAACDIRVASECAILNVKESALGIPADLGTLQRLPRLVGNASVVREWTFTARDISAHEAHRVGLFSRLEKDQSAAMKAAEDIAKRIVSMSPTANLGAKAALNAVHREVDLRGLEQQAVSNGALLQSDDITKAFGAAKKKQTPQFSKL